MYSHEERLKSCLLYTSDVCIVIAADAEDSVFDFVGDVRDDLDGEMCIRDRPLSALHANT